MREVVKRGLAFPRLVDRQLFATGGSRSPPQRSNSIPQGISFEATKSASEQLERLVLGLRRRSRHGRRTGHRGGEETSRAWSLRIVESRGDDLAKSELRPRCTFATEPREHGIEHRQVSGRIVGILRNCPGSLPYGRYATRRLSAFSDRPRDPRKDSTSLELLTPVEPGKIVCVGLNYDAHVTERDPNRKVTSRTRALHETDLRGDRPR